MQPFLSIQISAAPEHTLPTHLHQHYEDDFWHIKNADNTINIRLKKRDAYPTTYCRKIAGAYVFGYGEFSNEIHDEYLHIVAYEDGRVEIIRDAFATLPIYYTAHNYGCTISNEYEYVVETVQQPTLNKDGIIEHLAMFSRIAPPVVHEVAILEEREELRYTPFAFSEKRLATSRSWAFSSDAPSTDPKEFMPYLTSHFDTFIGSRLSGQNFAFQVSGGLDSATLPQYFATKYKQHTPMASMLFTDKYAAPQMAKLQRLYTGRSSMVMSSSLNPAAHFPLARMILSGDYSPNYSEHMYSECMIPLADQMQEQGIKVLCTGEGGDELFLNITPSLSGFMAPEDERAFRLERTLAPFLTQKFREEYIDNAGRAPITLPHRHHNMGFAQRCNNLYIRRDIWPVSPFFDSNLYNFCQGIPAHLRANKNILRAFHQAHGFEKAVYDTIENEYFDVFLSQCFRSSVYDILMQRLLKNSVTIDKGYVDADIFLQTYAECASDDMAFQMYLFLNLEINLQFTRGLIR